MNKIVSKVQFSEKVFKLEVEAPLIAKARRAGHFVIVRVDEKGERVPLTIAGSDVEKGTITLVIQTVGASTSSCVLSTRVITSPTWLAPSAKPLILRTMELCSAREAVSAQLPCCLSSRRSRLPATV